MTLISAIHANPISRNFMGCLPLKDAGGLQPYSLGTNGRPTPLQSQYIRPTPSGHDPGDADPGDADRDARDVSGVPLRAWRSSR